MFVFGTLLPNIIINDEKPKVTVYNINNIQDTISQIIIENITQNIP